MSHPSVHVDPATANDSTPKATTGRLYYWAGSENATVAPPGVYRYVQIKDLAVANGDVLCPDAEAGDGMDLATKDRSADLLSTACIGVAVGTVTADYYTYILVQGRHQAVKTDTSITLGAPLMPHATTDGAADIATGTASGGVAPAIIFGVALENDSSAGYASADINCI